MRTRAFLTIVFLVVPFARYAPAGQGEPGSARAFIEAAAVRSEVWVGETAEVLLRFGFEQAHFAELVPLFRRELDLSVQVDAPWADGDDCRVALPQPTSGAPVSFGFALNAQERRATRTEEELFGRTYIVFTARLPFRAACDGDVALFPSRLRYAYASESQKDPFGRDVALDRKVLTVSSQPAEYTVSPFPEADRPPEFNGAVGRFELRREVEFGSDEERDRLALTVTVEGRGTLLAQHAPSLSGFAGIHVVASSATALAPPERGMAFRFELQREAHVRSLPSFRFVYFEPTPEAAYRSLVSAALPWPRPAVTVSPDAASDSESVASSGAPANASETPAAPSSSRALHLFWLLPALALIALLARRRPRPTPASDGFATAVAQFRDRLGEGADSGHVLDELLARLIGRNPALLSPQEVETEMRAKGAVPAAAELAASLHEAAHSAEYGRGAQGPDPESLEALARLLER